jgi:hypothetical protein
MRSSKSKNDPCNRREIFIGPIVFGFILVQMGMNWMAVGRYWKSKVVLSGTKFTQKESVLSKLLPSELLTVGHHQDSYYQSWYFASDQNRTTQKDLLIAIATVNIEGHPVPYYRVTRSMTAEYARRHEYDFHVLRMPLNPSTNRSMHWQKILSAIYLLTKVHLSASSQLHNGGRQYDYLFWMDADTMIMNLNKSLEDIISMARPEKSIIISGDTNIINSAQVLWGNTYTSIHTLETLWEMECRPNVPLYENGQFSSMIAGCKPQDTPEAKKECYNRVDFYRGKGAAEVATQIKAGNISGIAVSEWAKRAIQWVPKTVMNSYRDDFRPGQFIFHSVGVGGHHKKPIWLERMFNESLIYNNIRRGELLNQYSL